LERGRGHGEGESDPIVTKNKGWKYLRAWRITAELLETSETRFKAREGWIAGGGECELERTGKGRRRGLGSVL